MTEHYPHNIHGIGTPRYFGKMLQDFRREEVGHNIAIFADKLELNPLVYSNWESGRNGLPTSEQIQLWGNKLGANMDMWDEMYGGAGYALPEDRDEEVYRLWALKIYRHKYEGAEHPTASAMRALLDNQPGFWKSKLYSMHAIWIILKSITGR